MKLYHVVAMANGRVIGRQNRLPWHFSADLRHFKQLTLGSTVIMGRRTFESIGKPLPERRNFVLSRSAKSAAGPGGPEFFDSLERALGEAATEKCFIIGGAELYRETLGRADGIYMTRIHADYDGDAFYPDVPESFRELDRRVLQDAPKLEVIYYERQTPGKSG